MFNLWSPVDANPREVEDLAFSCYAKHQTELDNIVNSLYNIVFNDCDDNKIDSLCENLSSSDLRYIQKQLTKKGVFIDFSEVD